MSTLKKYQINSLRSLIKGEVLNDKASLISYATDASVYYEEPIAIVIPECISDIEKALKFANEHKLSIIPRAAGTSLAGQVVGYGLVIDISKHFSNIIEVNNEEKWVSVEPGVILDELNRHLASYGLFFGPEASTANRCMIGGMVGNNACGLHAVVYGTTRDHLLEVSGYLSDGSFVTFKPLQKNELNKKCELPTLEGAIYRNIKATLDNKRNRTEIVSSYPDKRLIRRNNGYALDQLLNTDPFTGNGVPLNVAKLIAGSEGTLLFITEVKLNLVELPPVEKALVCAHFKTINNALKANIIALKHKVRAVELMDDIVLNASKNNIEQAKNRFFVEGNPKALLMIELAFNNKQQLNLAVDNLIADLKESELGYHFPVLHAQDMNKAWNLRKAGLGIMANIPGDTRSITVIEDTAVHTDVLPDYIAEFSKIMKSYGEECVYHAHAGTGEIHLRPRLNLKKQQDIEKFEQLAWDIAKLVKKYNGSLSGEHGDGRLRGQFIPYMFGDHVYSLLKELKSVWDPNNIFNPGKIIDTPPMRDNLRYKQGETKHIKTHFNFNSKLGIVRAAESCNGSGDCRKLQTAGGTMCPSYRATLDEKHLTRSRANVLREFLLNSTETNPFNHNEIYDALDLCLSCKACKSECPSSVDVTKLKAEFLQHWYDANGIPLRTRAIANISKINKIGALLPGVNNFLLSNKTTSNLVKKALGIAKQRSLPTLKKTTLEAWVRSRSIEPNISYHNREIVLFIDEFTNYNDTDIGIKTIQLLTKLGYKVNTVPHVESGRALLSKGMLKKAKKIAAKNVLALCDIINEQKPLVGIEPSAILSFRDEYPELVEEGMIDKAQKIARHCYTIDEFFALERKQGFINCKLFKESEKNIVFHGHCQQKAIATTRSLKEMLTIPKNYHVAELQTGCCGMAGSFGYEKEHYDISMKIGELSLFPKVRSTHADTLIVASGTSCRHQIADGTNRKALHPVEVLYDALIHEG